MKVTLMVAGYLLGAGKPYYALGLLALIAPQVFFQVKYTIKSCDIAKDMLLTL